MPQYQITVPGQGTFSVDSPTELTDLQAWQAVQNQLAAGPSKERTWGETAKDIAAGVVSGAGSLVQLPGQLYGLATGDFSETGALGLGKDIVKFGEEMKSAGLKAREAERSKKIQEAEQKGQFEAFKTAFGETIKDPALLTSFLAEQAPQLLVPFGAAKVAQVGTAAKAAAAAEGLVGTAAKEAVETVTKAAAERGTKAAIGAGAVQQGSDVGAQSYEDIYKELRSKGASEADAAEGAINLARASGASGALISLLAQRLPGARSLEESLAGVKGTSGRLLGAVKGAAGEGVSEITEETGGKFGANLAMQQVKPEQSLLEGLGQTAGMAAIGGVGMGGVSGALRTLAQAEVAAAPEAPPPVAPPAAPPAPPPALEYKPEPFIQFPDGTVAKQSEVEAYIKTLPEDEQMAMRTKLLGLAPQEAEVPTAEPTKALEFKPTPLIVYPDGSVARSGEVETYIQSLPEDEQVAARTKLLGMGEVATEVTPEILKNLGIRSRAPIIQRLSGLELTDPKVTEELTNFAAQPFASPEVRGNIFGFLNTIKPIKPTAPAAAPAEAAPKVEVPAPKPIEPTATTAQPAAETPAPEGAAAAPVSAAPTVPSGFVYSLTSTPAYEGVAPLSIEDADFELEALQNQAAKGRLTPDQFGQSEIAKRLDTGQVMTINDGLRVDPVGTITALRERLNQEPAPKPAAVEAPAVPAVEATAPVAPTPTAPAPAPAAPKFEPQIVSRQPAPDGMEVHVFTTTDGYGTGLFDADANQYVNGSVTRFIGEDTLPKAQARAAEMLQKATPVEAATPTAKTPSERQERIAFGKAIGATQPYPGSLTGRVNLPAQKAAQEGNFQGVLSALEKSKNVIVAEIAKRAKSLGTKIVIDSNAEETYTGPSTLMRQMSIDGAKMHLEALEKIRALAPQVDALPDKAELSYAIRGETINAIDNGESAGRMGLEDIARMGHSMFAPLSIGESKLRTKEDFKRLQKAYEDLTSEYGENALQLTSTGSAEMRGVAGAYDADTDTIRVPKYAAKREEVLSHEIVHAQTVQSIANPTLRQKPIVARLNKLYEHVKKELEGRPGRAPYGIQSIQEFVAEGMGNPAFQFLLKKIKYENTSAWDSFVQTIANLIGVKRDTAFTELLSIYSDLTTEQKTAPKAPAVKAPAPKAEAPAAPAVEAAATKVEAPAAPAAPKKPAFVYRSGGGDQTKMRMFTEDETVEFNDVSGKPQLVIIGKNIAGTGEDSIVVYHNNIDRRSNVYDAKDLQKVLDVDTTMVKAIQKWLASDASTITSNGQALAKTLSDFVEGNAAETPAAPKAEAPPTLDTTGITPVKGRHPQVQAAAKLLQDKKMSREEFEKYVDYYKPIQEVESEKLLPPTSEQRMNETVNADKRDRINVPVADGTKVGLRMDLPARERGGSVVSIHEGKPGKMTVGKLMGFRSTGWLKDVTFEVRSQEKGLAVAAGAAKAPQQTVEGTWFNLGPEETYARVKELMKDPAWKQIGFDPSRHGYFYDRKTTQPVVSASEMYQVGQFLLAKDVKYAPKSDYLYSLGGERAQVQAFEQDLRKRLDKFGLKDVGLKIQERMTDSGSYAAQIVKIAADAANPVRTLRHEAIHALRELGFFTDAQWSSLSKMAKDKWIDQYLKQRNVDGKPLKAGEESRYDAYMREYNGDMEKITEEAVGDAFADFDATKPPAGMLQALLKRMKDLFQSIKSALTKVESPEQIFGKVEKGELKAGAREEAGERKSLGGRNPGEQAISIVNSLGMGVKPPEPGRAEKAMKMLKDAGENPSLTKESAKKTLTKWLDWFETTVFSSDSAFNNKIRRGIISDFKQNPEVLGMLLEASQSQTVHADALASQFMIDGGLQYNEELKKWESVKKEDNFVALAKKIEELAKKYNVTKDEMERIAHTYFVAKRLPGIIKRNEELDADIAAERATAKPDRKQIEEWESLKVYVSDEQLAMMEPGLSLVKTIPELKEVVDIWQGIRKNNIDVMVNSGLWSPEYATAMWDNMDYVPYYREEQLEEGAGPQEFIRGLQVKSKEFQLKGSGAAVNDVFDNMIRWSQYAMNRAIRAHKATQMIDAALKIEVDGKPMATKVTEQKRGMNIVRAFRDGKQELYDMADPLFVPAFSSIQNVSIPTLTFMSKVSNVLRQSVVLYPLFSVAQVPQDSFAAMFSSGLKTQHALKIPYLAVKEFIKTLSKTSQTHNELTKYGVVGVRDFSATVIRDDAEIYAGLKPPKGGWGKTKEFLEHVAMAADNAVRQAVYEASMQQGLNKSEALEKAFEIINFRRRGTSKMLNVMGQTVPFFYAYLSAQRVAYRVLSGVGISPTERKEALTTLATTSAAVATLSMLYAMAAGDDEDYAETPAAIRDRTLTIPGSGGVRIPLRPDFFLFPKIVAEHTYLMLSDKGYEDGAKFRKSMADALLSAVASPTPFPTAIKPAIEVAINYDFFQGKPLIGNFEKQKDVERQFRDSTSELAKLFGETGLISPIAADHMIRGMLGSFGGLLLFGTNQFLHSDPDVPRPELSAKEMLAALPGTSGLLKRPQESALKNDFYVLRDEVEKAANTFSDIKNRSPEGIQAFLEDEKNMARLGLAKGVDKINRELSKIRKVMTQITNMPESQMSGDEKSENIQQLRELEREILRSVNVKELREMAKI